MWILILLMKSTGYIFHYFTVVLGLNFFGTLHSIILRGVSILYTKFWISQRKPNQKRNYFNPLVSGPGRFEWWKNWGSKILLDCPFNKGNLKKLGVLYGPCAIMYRQLRMPLRFLLILSHLNKENPEKLWVLYGPCALIYQNCPT